MMTLQKLTDLEAKNKWLIDTLDTFGKTTDGKISKLEIDAAINEFFMLDYAGNALVNEINQYDLGANDTCKDIKSRLSPTAALIKLLQPDDKTVQDTLSNLIEVNSDNDYLVKDLEYVKRCLE
jgi:hypothetical protein